MSTTSEEMNNKITKEDFVVYTTTHAIEKKGGLKRIEGVQRKKLGLKTRKEADDLQKLSILLFCRSHFREALKLGFQEPNVAQLVRLWKDNTKKDRMDLYMRTKEWQYRQLEMQKKYAQASLNDQASLKPSEQDSSIPCPTPESDEC